MWTYTDVVVAGKSDVQEISTLHPQPCLPGQGMNNHAATEASGQQRRKVWRRYSRKKARWVISFGEMHTVDSHDNIFFYYKKKKSTTSHTRRKAFM